KHKSLLQIPNPKQHSLPEQQTHILPDASQVVGPHTWKVAAYKDALARKLPLVGRCSFIQHGLCHVCTASATTNTNPALVLNVCPHFDFGHSVCVVHFEQLTRTLVSTMLEQGGGGGVPACPVCLHGCTCAVCTRVLTTQIELYDAYRASTSTSRGPSEYQGDVAANSLSPPWLHPNATSSDDVSVRQASITTSATRERTTSTRPTPPSYHGLIDADNLSDAASAQLWRRKPSSLLPPMMQADAKQDTDELVRRVGPDSVTGFSPSSKATHHPTTRAREHPDGTGVVPSYPDVGPAQRRPESRPAHDEAKHTQDDDIHVSRDSGLIRPIDGPAVTADEKKSPAAAMLPLQSFKETQRKQQASVVQQPKAASKAIAPTTTLTTHGGKQGGGMAAEPKGGLANAPKQASKDIAGTTINTDNLVKQWMSDKKKQAGAVGASPANSTATLKEATVPSMNHATSRTMPSALPQGMPVKSYVGTSSSTTTTKTIDNAMSLEGRPPSSVTESNNPRKRPASETCETSKRGRLRRGDQTAAAAVAVAVAIAASTASSSSMRKGVDKDTHDDVAELVGATTPSSRRPASSKKKAKRSHDDDDDDDEATSRPPPGPGKRVCTIKRETPVDDDVKIESDDDDDVDTNLDFCSICKQDGDLVCCDVCPRSFHLTCINKREDQLPLDTWQCHECQHNLSDTHVQKVCRDLTKLRNKVSNE
ncbi:hypothetical protein DYB28_006521, partial [Aphanomyces astaci]